MGRLAPAADRLQAKNSSLAPALAVAHASFDEDHFHKEISCRNI
jgi:hypothetical protein